MDASDATAKERMIQFIRVLPDDSIWTDIEPEITDRIKQCPKSSFSIPFPTTA